MMLTVPPSNIKDDDDVNLAETVILMRMMMMTAQDWKQATGSYLKKNLTWFAENWHWLKIEERLCTKNLLSWKKYKQFLGGWCVQEVQHRQELERSLQGRLVSQFGSRGMELSQKSQLVCWMIKHMCVVTFTFTIPFQVLYVRLKIKLASLVQSPQGRIFYLDLQLPKTGRSQPKRSKNNQSKSTQKK